jgi:rod shape-determining protein MreC
VPRGARTDSRADTAIAAGCVLASLLLLILPDTARDRVAGGIRGTVVAPLVAMQQRAALARRAFVDNDSLVRIADSVALRSQRLEEVTAENERLRGLLGLGRSLRWGFVPAEALMGRGLGDEYTLVLSAGRRAGVERLSAVVAPEGLVGMVEQVDATTSIAITWPHPDFRVSATSVDGSAFGIVSAHQGPGAEGYLLELQGVAFRSTLRAGTPIVTSGLGGVYPRGIFIGTVIEELRSTAGWAHTYLLRPAVRPPDVTTVMILSPDRNAEGVESVWAGAVEPFARRVVTAGDSLARRTRDSLAAATRQRLVDSLSAALRAADTLPRRTP